MPAPRRLVLLLVATLAHAAAARTLPLFTLPLEALQSPTGATYDGVRQAMAEVGMLAVTLGEGEEGTTQNRQTLQAFVQCLVGEGSRNAVADSTKEVVLDDGATRTSLSAAANFSRLEPLAASVQTACPRFAEASAALRDTVDATGKAFALLLDHLSDGPVAVGDRKPNSFYDAASNAESLEHFHLFTRPKAADEGQGSALHMHSDMGMFLIMTPAQYFDLATTDPAAPSAGLHSGFYLQLPSGEHVHPTFPKNSLLLMGGEGAARWMHRQRTVEVYAPPHEVVLPPLDGLGRAWYGRMYFPPRDATLVGGVWAEDPDDDPELAAAVANNLTFGQLREQTYQAFHQGKPESALALGCHPKRRSLQDDNSCNANQIWCWMSCQSIADLDCQGNAPECRNPGGQHWPEDFTDPSGTIGHCMDCTPQCPLPPPPPPFPLTPPGTNNSHHTTPPVQQKREEHELCNTNFQATVMWMTGFQRLSGDHGQPCVALLFEGWELDTKVKFTMGCIGTFLSGLMVEFLVCFRRKMRNSHMNFTQREMMWAHNLGMLLLYAIQVTLGYFMMLIAMTYQVELFMMVVMGLTAGHGLFNLNGPVLESAEACCAGFEVDEETSSRVQHVQMNGDSHSLDLQQVHTVPTGTVVLPIHKSSVAGGNELHITDPDMAGTTSVVGVKPSCCSSR